MQVIPTLLTNNITEFIEQVHLFQKYYNRIQIDIADGNLVPNTTTQIEEIIYTMQKGQIQITNKNLSFDFHLMVMDYRTELRNIKQFMLQAQVQAILVNAGLTPDLKTLKNEYPYFSIGLDIHPDMEIDALARHYDLNSLTAMQVMTVNPGFQGSPFLSEMMDKIEQLREKGYSGQIFIDGGVNDKTIPTILEKKYQPNFYCIGSYLTKAGDILEERIEELKRL